MSQWYDLVVFTASMEIYGAAVADKLDGGRGILRRRYYRQHCTLDYGSYTKDLAAICPDLASIFILDNSPGAYRQYPGVCVRGFVVGCLRAGSGSFILGGTVISVVFWQ